MHWGAYVIPNTILPIAPYNAHTWVKILFISESKNIIGVYVSLRIFDS